MKGLLRRGGRSLLWTCRFFGFDPRFAATNLASIPLFVRQVNEYQRLNSDPTFQIRLRHLYPVLNESRQGAAQFDSHYFHQDLWAAKKIFNRRPEKHIDIGSRLDGFIAHLLVFMPVSMVDIRPLDPTISGLAFVRDDATELGMFQNDSVDSISSLNAAEHFGLGRYSDPIDPTACIRFMRSLRRVLAPGGRLYFSVPIGRQRVEFNAHRIFGVRTVLDIFEGLELLSFSFVGSNGRFHEDALPEDAAGEDAARTDYGCGLFEFTKPIQ